MTEFLKRLVRDTAVIEEQLFIIVLSLLALTVCLFIIYWFYTRKKIHQLAHSVPASVLKNYLDSIIQNSRSLKSSLFRGGGLDVGEGVPSIVPLQNDTQENIVEVKGEDSHESVQKDAKIMSLERTLEDKSSVIIDLEKKIQELENFSQETIKEKSFFEKELLEYKILKKDLSSLKIIKEENQQLKEKLKEQLDQKEGEFSKKIKKDNHLEEVNVPAQQEDEEKRIEKEKKVEKEKEKEEEKSPEDFLKEFGNMLD